MSESSRIARLARIFATRGGGIEVGIGDDAAVLAVEGAGGAPRLVWTIDEQVDGVHFRRDFASWRDVGWRSFMAAASDIAAMGAVPWGALSAIVVPDDVDDAALEDLACGQRSAADAVGAAIVGGNLSRGPAFSVATTLLGRCDRAVLRSGARSGDGLWMAGSVGLAATGLRALEGRGATAGPLGLAVSAWRTPAALVDAGRAMAPVAHAAVDVSDGLACDVSHLAEASGAHAVLDASALLLDRALVDAATALGLDALEVALYGGEDYAIVAASPVAIEGFRLIGEITTGSGVALRGPNGTMPLEPHGFDHFTSGKPKAASRS